MNWLAERLPPDAKVLEIGPGFVPFPKATQFVDYRELPNIPADKIKYIDLASQPLPFADKEFDFIYCRHVLEDMYNPFFLILEMNRVGKAGYIELPSPMAELGRGVDGNSPPFRGYHHHHWIGWIHEGEFRIISKYPLIEYLRFDEEQIVSWLKEGPEPWNTHYLWEGEIKFAHRRNGPDYVLTRDYAATLKDAMDSAKVSSGLFWQKLPRTNPIAQAL